VEVVEAKYEGEDIVAAFNPAYLLDGLTAAVGDQVKIEVRDGLKPAVVRGDREAFVYLVMPVRLPAPVG
jgi:DNA polymerase-3 subunit beta